MTGTIVAVVVAVVLAPPLGMAAYLALASERGRRTVIEADGYSLNTRVYGEAPAGGLAPGLLFVSGWNPGGSGWTPSDICAGLAAKRLDALCMTLALRGMGSPGEIAALTRADFLADVTAAYDHLAGLEGVDPDRISVAGESLGSYLACVLSARRPVRALALRVPTDFPDAGFRDVPQERIAGLKSLEWKRQEHSHVESRALDALHAFAGDILIVASERDSLVPMQTTQNYLSSVPDPNKVDYRLMRRAGHGLGPARQIEFIRVLLEWLCRHA